MTKIEGKNSMRLANKQVLSFIHEDRFDLHAYVTYLFNQLNNQVIWKA